MTSTEATPTKRTNALRDWLRDWRSESLRGMRSFKCWLWFFCAILPCLIAYELGVSLYVAPLLGGLSGFLLNRLWPCPVERVKWRRDE